MHEKSVRLCTVERVFTPLARKSSHLVSCTVSQNQKQILITYALDVMLGSNREKNDISNADVEVGGDSRENNSNLGAGKAAIFNNNNFQCAVTA